MKLIAGGVTSPHGFKANGIVAGIKKSGKSDLALIVSDVPAIGAGVFTKNSVIAAPLVISKKHIKKNKVRAIIANSGNANCFTGEFGLLYADQTTQIIAKLLNIPKTEVIVTSTGIIGKMLPFEKIENSATKLVNGLNHRGGTDAAKAIMTTDTIVKECATEISLGGKKVMIGGCAKGSGMIAPNMATMLGFITTDVAISIPMLKKSLAIANDKSFNSITVDGCMSTNDMVVIMANGLAKNPTISKTGKDFDLFTQALSAVCMDLAKKIVIDGEGATKFITINVTGAKTEKQAREVGLAIANSALVKTAAFGSNPNWGRVAAAAGSLGIKGVEETNLKIDFSPFDKKEIAINVGLNLGKEQATVYTSDLSYEYVKINVEYT